MATLWILLALGVLWVIATMAHIERELFEDGTGGEGETFEDPIEIYDDFYAKVYDTLFSTPDRVVVRSRI